MGAEDTLFDRFTGRVLRIAAWGRSSTGQAGRWAHYGLEEWEKDISTLRVAGLRGLSAVRIGHPMD